MRRPKSDLEISEDEARFKKYDDQLSSNITSNKQFKILVIGIIVLLGMFSFNYISTIASPTPIKYELGLNISYEPQNSQYLVEYTNPNSTTNSMKVIITTPLDDKMYVTNFEHEERNFPTNVTYTPYDKQLPHIVSVMLSKNTGNYTYMYASRPVEEEAKWSNFERWLPK